MGKPARKEKPSEAAWDVLLPEVQNAVYDALRPLDKIAADVERRWGASRILTLVPTEIAARFGLARDKLNAAIKEGDPEQVKLRAEVMVRGWKALEQAAVESGHTPAPSDVWSVNYEGRTYVITARREDVEPVGQYGDTGAIVMSVHELLLAFTMLRERQAIEAAKVAWPGATVSRFAKEIGDDIPF